MKSRPSASQLRSKRGLDTLFAVLAATAMLHQAPGLAAPVTSATSASYDNHLYRPGQSGDTEETAGNASTAGGDSNARFNAVDDYGSRTNFASASLSSGQLKGMTSTTGNVGRNGSSVFSTALLADSFRTFSGGSPFVWSGNTASFSFQVDGSSAKSGAHADTYGYLRLFILSAGALNDSVYFYDNHYSLFTSDTFESALLYQFSYGLTPESTSDTDFRDFSQRPVDALIDPANAARVTANFAPGGDFDWIMTLDTASDLSIPGTSDFAYVDLAHTITASYSAPMNTTTYSASGLFPGTAALAASDVPEPQTLALLGLGIAAALLSRPRMSTSRAVAAPSR